MGVDHTARVRPGDRWDGLTLVVTRSGVDWASAVWALNVRSYPRGPVVLAIAPTVTINGDTVTLVFHLSGEATRALRIGTTYHGEVSVHVAGALPGDEPAFGPYTLFTWSLEAVLSAQTAATQYTITWAGSTATFNIDLAVGIPAGPAGPAGIGFRLGDPLYIHPTSRNLWFTVDGTIYYPAVRSMVDGKPLLGWDETAGTTTPT